MTTIKLRRGTAAQWASAATVLAAGEPGIETDTGVYKIGDGVTAWASLNPVLNGTYAKADPVVSITYNTDGTVATVVEDGITTSFTYNADGSVATTTRSGITHTYSYTAGNLVGVA